MTDYTEKANGGAPHALGTLVKYGAFMSGVYAVSRDKPDLGLVILSGALYLLGEAIVRIGESVTSNQRFNQLEQALTQNQTDKSRSKLEN